MSDGRDDENVPAIRMSIGNVLKVDVKGTEEESTEDIKQIALELVDEANEDYDELLQVDERRGSEGSSGGASVR